MPNATRAEVERFLAQVRKTIPTSFDMRRAAKNKEAILALGYNYAAVKQEIESLEASHFSEGPVDEHNAINQVWIFGKIIQNREVYIKIKLIGMNNQGREVDTVHCLSFHFAEYNLDYPYGTQEGV